MEKIFAILPSGEGRWYDIPLGATESEVKAFCAFVEDFGEAVGYPVICGLVPVETAAAAA